MEQVREKTGRLAANGDILQLNVQGLASLAIDVVGSMIATLVFEYTINGSDWYTMTVNVVGSATTATGAIAAGKWVANVAGFSAVRIRCSAYTSGTPAMTLRAVLSGGGAGSTSGGDTQTFGADGENNTANAQRVASRIYGFNGTTWDRIKAGITTVTATLTGFLNTLPWAVYHTTPSTRTDGQGGPLEADSDGNLQNTLATAIAGEDLTNDVLKTEQRYIGSGVLLSDTLVKSGAGFVHAITFSCNDAAPTAGTIDILDAISAGGTPKIFSWTLTITPFSPVTIILDQEFANGLYVDFTTVADVGVVVSYR